MFSKILRWMSCFLFITIIISKFAYSEIIEFPIDIQIINDTFEITGYLDDENPEYWAIKKDELLPLLQKYLDAERLTLISGTFPQDTIGKSDLAFLGWSGEYLEDELLIKVKIPLQDRQVMDIALTQKRSKTPPDNLPKAEPHAFSGVINTYITHTHNLTNTEYYYDTLALRTAIAMGPFTLEDGHTFYRVSEGEQPGWQRDQTRLLFDLPNETGLIQIGDYGIETSINSLSSGDIFGISYSYQPAYFALESRPNIIPIQLETNSTVNIRINGQEYQTMRLAPGRYNLRDLPLDGGVNIVEITYTDQGGQEQTKFYNLIDHPELLNEGDIETQWVAGAWQEYNDDGVKEIIEDRAGAQMVFSYGLTEWWTISNLVEWEELKQNYGIEQSFSLGDNFLSVDTSYNQSESAESIVYGSSFFVPFLLWDTLSNSSFNYRYTNNQITGINTQNLGFSSGINLPIENGFVSFGLGTTIQDEEYDYYTASINTSYRLWDKLTTSINLRSEWGRDKEEYSAYVSLSIPLNFNGISLYGRSSYDTSKNENNSEISASKYDKDYNWRATAKFVESDYESADIYAKTNGKRANFFGRLTSQNERAENPKRIATLGLESGLAWAGTDLHWTSPIGSSFSIVSLSDDFEGYGLHEGDYGRLSIVSSEIEDNRSVLLPVTDRNYRQVNIHPSGLDFNEELAQSSFVALGGIRRGSAFELSLLKGYFVTGTLFDESNMNIGEVVGELVDKNSSRSYPFFTDELGSFELDMIPNGEYRIRLFDSSHQADSVTIASEKAIEDTFIDLGEVRLKK